MRAWRNCMAAVLLGVMVSCASPGRTAQLDAGAPAQSASAVAATPSAARPFVDAHAIIILRHGDIDPAVKARLGNQTPLLPRGEKRAQEIVTAFRDAGVTRIVTSTALRTQATAAPLAQALQITPEEPFKHGPEQAMGPGAMPMPEEAGPLFDFLAKTAQPSQTILLVEHHSLIPGLMADFGFTHEPKFDDATEFDRAYVILPDAAHHTYHLLRLRFGGNWGALQNEN